jgi:drug/metabolite transporter (DMT)-like permease
MSSEVVFTAVVGIVFLGDPATWRFWAGGLLILTSGIAMNRLRTSRRPAGEGGA